jgi:hypothetical protein
MASERTGRADYEQEIRDATDAFCAATVLGADAWAAFVTTKEAVFKALDALAAERDRLAAALRDIRDNDLFEGGAWDWQHFLDRHGVVDLLDSPDSHDG